MPELIEHRVTGFLVDTLDEAVETIGRIGEIDRASCRALHGQGASPGARSKSLGADIERAPFRTTSF
jgi:hypothetical protein